MGFLERKITIFFFLEWVSKKAKKFFFSLKYCVTTCKKKKQLIDQQKKKTSKYLYNIIGGFLFLICMPISSERKGFFIFTFFQKETQKI